MGLLFMWFSPWVLTLNLGFLAYFPYHPDGQTRFLRLTGPLVNKLNHNWTPSQEIPSFCKESAVGAEDQKFFTHNGIDIDAIKQNLIRNEKLKKIKRGGSTITQQLVKNAFLSRERSYLRKARELEGAVLVNLFLSKDAQLTWYWNIIEFGDNIYGIREAARFYFHTDPKYLTPPQCIALTAIIPSPKKWNKSLRTKNITPFFKKRYFTILRHMKNMGLANHQQILLASKIFLWNEQKEIIEQKDDLILNYENADFDFDD